MATIPFSCEGFSLFVLKEKPHSKYDRLQKVRSVWFKKEKKTCWCLRAIWLVLGAATAAAHFHTRVSLHLLDRYEQHGYHNLFLCSSTGRQATKELDEQTDRKSVFLKLTDILSQPQWSTMTGQFSVENNWLVRQTTQDFPPGLWFLHVPSVASQQQASHADYEAF